MMITRHQTDGLMSQVVCHAGVAYLSGQVDLDGSARSTAEQTQRVLARIDHLLAAVGSSNRHLLSATIWLADLADFAAMNQAWAQWLPHRCAPARATVQASLALPGLKVEIAVVAALQPSNQSQTILQRRQLRNDLKGEATP